MRKILIMLLLIVVAIASFGTSSAKNNAKVLTATLSGAAEIPGPGDSDGYGTATLELEKSKQKVCYTLSVSLIAPATAATIFHITKEGDVAVMSLEAPFYGTSSGCLTGVSSSLIKSMLKTPQRYYINVFNARFKNGAVRGSFSQ